MQFKVFFDDERFTSTIVEFESLEEAQAQHPEAVSIERFDPFGLGPSAQETTAMANLFSDAPVAELCVSCVNCAEFHQDDDNWGTCTLTGLEKFVLGSCHQFTWDPEVLRLHFES